MRMNTIQKIQQQFSSHLATLFNLPAEKVALLTLELNLDEHKQAFGDLTTNAAMVLAKELKKNPREVAATIINSFNHPLISRMEIAGPGFINLFLDAKIWGILAEEYLSQGATAFKPLDFTPEHINI